MRSETGVEADKGMSISTNGVRIEDVEKFKYLGIIERPDNSMNS